jgi:c-di-GMP-binding flagellar brake protein YcgR
MMMSFNGQERRKFVRLKEPLPVKLRLLDKKNSAIILDWKECTTHDISRGGVCVQIADVDMELRKAITNTSNILELAITLHAGKQVTVKGNINYISALGKTVWNYFKNEILEVGMKFTEISDGDENSISDFIVQQYVEKYGA